MKAVIYSRYSSDNQREESIDAQLRACHEYCTRLGYDVVGTYIDQALTATSDDRPEFQRMVADSSGAGWSFVVVHKLDRFARNRYDAAIYKKKLRMNGARLLSVLENLDDSPESVIMESVLEGMAEYYSRNLSREVKKGLRENAFQGKTTGGFPPLGYDLDSDGHYIINEEEAAIIRLIFSWAREGQSYRKICAALNTMGAHTKVGKQFVPNSIHDILRNEKYRGALVYNRFQRGVDGKRRRHALGGNPDTIIHNDGVPALVAETDWYAINAAMDSRRQTDRTHKGEQYLLAGRLRCGVCGGAMSGHRTRDVRYYKCCRRKSTGDCTLPMIACSKVDNIILESLKVNILNHDVLAELLPAIVRQASRKVIDAGIDHQAIRDRMESLEKEIIKVVDAISVVGISQALRTKLRALEDEKKVALMALADAETEARKYAVDTDGIREKLMSDIDALQNGSPADIRRLIEIYVENITINPPAAGKRSGHGIDVRLSISHRQQKSEENAPRSCCQLMVPPRECFQLARSYTVH